MRLVVDTSALVADLLRVQGRQRLADDRLELFIAEHTVAEVTHELPRRIAHFARRREIASKVAERLWNDCRDSIATNLSLVPEAAYAPLEPEARRRMSRDPSDWPVVAAALAIDGAVWTNDNDFLGSGVATWTTETLRSWLLNNQ